MNDRTLSSLVPGFEQYDLKLVAFGHTHEQRAGEIADFARGASEEPAGQFVNPGSIGQPRDGDPKAAYAMVELKSDGSIQIYQHRVEYPIDETRGMIETVGLPEATGDRLLYGE